MFDFLTQAARASEAVIMQCSFGSFAVGLRSDDFACVAVIGPDGAVVHAGDDAPAPDFTLSASAAAWEAQRSLHPRPGFQALSTMKRCGHLEVTGDLLLYNRNLLLLEALFTPAERQATNTVARGDAPTVEPIIGQYLNLDIDGRVHRLYFESAGEGIPLVCLHTAGADGRQYRALLNDAAITSRFRVMAFDLPWHGKSSPPKGFEREVYRLGTDRYVNIVMAFIRALGLDNPVVMGCSIGGRVVLHLAMRHADELRAVIGLQSALYAEDRTGQTEVGSERVLHRPDVHGAHIAGALMNGVMAPASPVAERWETMWHYMQGGPGIFMGDLHYYFDDGDLRGRMQRSDPDRCPVYLLSGEYDPSATPEMGEEAAKEIGAVHFEAMRDMGHFPMSENPSVFREYLLPVLERIAGVE